MSLTEFREYDGDRAYVGDEFDDDGDLNIFGKFLRRAEVARLRDHLTKLLDDAPKLPSAPVAVSSLAAGREYRLLPGAHSGEDGYPESCFRGATRALLTHSVPDGDGDVRVTLLDGTHGGSSGFYVHHRFLAPLDPAPTSSPIAALAAREVAAMYRAARTPYPGPQLDSTYAHLGEAFDTFADKLEGKPE